MSPYPIGYEADFVEQRSRASSFFRLLLAIPLVIVAYVYGIALVVTLLLSVIVLLFTGRYPQVFYNFNGGVIRYSGRLQAYVMLMTDAYPSFGLGEDPSYPVRISIGPRKEKYSRLRVFFRFIIGIPVLLINYALNLLAQVCAFMSWFAILFTGRQNRDLFEAIKLGNSYGTRAMAYFMFLTEEWPPFHVTEGTGPAEPASTETA